VPRGGSQPGERRGGRKKGTPNKASAAKAAEIASSGITPLEYMLKVMRAPIPSRAGPQLKAALEANKLDAAKSAAPYVHPKLAQVDIAHGTKEGKPFEIVVHNADDAL
jgi:hypothetical protein